MTMTDSNCLTLLSGGLDSTVLLAHLLDAGDTVETTAIDYGQRHRRELDAASEVAVFYGVTHHLVDLATLGAVLASPLTGHSSIPAPSVGAVVPNRNMILLAVAAGIATSRGLGQVATAVHAGDHAQYPDCTPAFIDAARAVLRISCGVGVLTPFITWSKEQIVEHGRELDVPFHLTWSCYQGDTEPCLTCGACVEREKALA